MKKLNKIIFFFMILILIETTIYAHGGNISGWNDKNSNNITSYNGKYYGYHKETGIIHYHQVKWIEEKNKWEIVNPSVYYEKKGNGFTLLKNTLDKDLLVKDVSFVEKTDGDTAYFSIDGQTIKVRFLGIDTPETVHSTKPIEPYGLEASEFTTNALKNAKNIRLEFEYNDNIFATQEEKTYNKNFDNHGRLLAWIFVDGTLLQEEIVKKGLGYTYMLTNSQKYAGVLQQAEEYAKENRLNLWSNSDYSTPTEENYDENIINDDYTQEKIVATVITVIIAIIAYVIKLGNNKTIKRARKNQ